MTAKGRTYRGRRGPLGVGRPHTLAERLSRLDACWHPPVVTVNGRPLLPRNNLRNHSPDGFEWGYGGSGPAQLALAILVDHFGEPGPALALYQRFKFRVIGQLTGDAWELTSEQVQAAIDDLGAEDRGETL